MNTATLMQHFADQRDRFIEEWKELLRFPSISTDPTHNTQCHDCAAWLQHHLEHIGFSASLLETPTKPAVFAERSGAPDLPTILFYGHYDVQPVDPVDAWITPPFEPDLRDGRLYARGAVDNKGQLFYALKALETLIQHNALTCPVKIILEGEEESGSQGMEHCLDTWRERLAADILVVTDSGTVQSGAPTIIMGLRGILHLTAELSGPSHDLHSGSHGGIAPNPGQAIAELAASLHSADGSIAVDGFYDGVLPPSPRELELATVAPFDATAYEAESGVPPIGGERNTSVAERLGFRPTLEVNGIRTGYAGPGMKTIIPATATLKLTARLVANQDPVHCMNAVIHHLNARVPPGLRLEIPEKDVAGPALKLNPDAPTIARAVTVLRSLSDQEPVFLWEGASIPIVARLAEVSTADPLLVGFGAEADRAHAPNESFSLDRFERGFRYVGSLLLELQGGEGKGDVLGS